MLNVITGFLVIFTRFFMLFGAKIRIKFTSQKVGRENTSFSRLYNCLNIT